MADTLKACQAVFELRDAIAVSLRVRKGMELSEIVILERANNMAMALVEQFEIVKRDEDGAPARCDCRNPGDVSDVPAKERTDAQDH